ncbi:hypothetical protein [Clostridium sp.]|jgi:hypothetical protein|uniref:hypothetical protein n=1 Tax=Clostridium sp. TaxID=1506 RepID=UPI003EE9A00C
MRKSIYSTLHFISISSSYLLVFSLIFIAQYFTIGLIPPLKHTIVFEKFYLKDFLFILTSTIILLVYVKTDSPYSKYISKH